MRTGLSAILQTLTPEAATVFNHSIAEAGRRNHNQTTPLHVAATLLAAPTGFLRQACIRSHPNSSHPLQCRALELCFSVALERLPSNATSSPAVEEPPVSNALMAALKRAQAHQRRGCPDQQQQPLLAVKVELEHLIISILDDPSVSRVMREASFSSPAVKATIEQHSLANNVVFRPSLPAGTQAPIPISRTLYMNQRLQRNDETSVSSSSSPMNLYLNPRLQMQKQGNLNLSLNQTGQQVRVDDVIRVMETMSKSNKKNPILVGEFDTESFKKEILIRIQNGDISTAHEFKNFDIISIEFPAKIDELNDVIEARIRNGSNRSIVIDIGDLKWLIELPATTDIGRESVAKIAQLVTKFGLENDNIWLIGTASCETYLKCQVYHPSLENDWDLQVVPISSTTSNRFGPNGMFGSSVESVNLFRNSDQMPPCCPRCFNDYEQELVKLNELEKSCVVEAKSNLPQWLQDAKAQCGESESESATSMPNRSRVNDQQLLKKWTDICLRIHPNHDQSPNFARMLTGFVPMVPMVNAYKPNRLLGQSQTGQSQETPRSPVHTELALGSKEVHEDLPVKDFLGCISSEPQAKDKVANVEDADSFKKLLKGLMKKAWWQPEAASTIAKIVTQRGSRGTMWWLFAGPDRAGKKKTASVLAEHVCGADPITICLGSRRDENEVDIGYRGKTVLDRIVESVRRNPFSVIVLSDIDEADMLVRGSIKQAMERGRLRDSHGREISLGNIIFVLTGNWSTNNADEVLDEKRLHLANVGCQLQLIVCEKRSKRRADWLPEGNMCTKQPRKAGSGLSLDLNLAMDVEEDRTDTSDLTIEQGDENPYFAIPSFSVPYELVGPSYEAVMFRPVQFGLIRREIENTVKTIFSSIVDKKLSIEVDEATLDNILSALWFGRTSLEDWASQVLVPSFHKLVGQLPSSFEDLVVCLESDRDWDLDQAHHCEDMLPSNIKVVIDTV